MKKKKFLIIKNEKKHTIDTEKRKISFRERNFDMEVFNDGLGKVNISTGFMDSIEDGAPRHKIERRNEMKDQKNKNTQNRYENKKTENKSNNQSNYSDKKDNSKNS